MPENATQVAALEAPDGWRSAPFLYIWGVIDRIAIGEPVGENMVKDGVLNPVRCCHYLIALQYKYFGGNFTAKEVLMRRKNPILMLYLS